MGATPPPAQQPAGAVPVVRNHRVVLALAEARATPERLAAYLCPIDRAVTALLSRDRLERLEPGRFLYRSRPFRLLAFELTPTLALQASWRESCLQIVCDDCRLQGLGAWQRGVAFTLTASLRPAALALEGELQATLQTPASLPGWGRSLAGKALEKVVQRIERRVQGGLRKDLLTWLLDPEVSG